MEIEEIVHDISINHWSKLLASACSDGKISIARITPDQPPQTVTTLMGHKAPVFSTSWSHPQYGNFLASGGYDQQIIIWQQEQENADAPFRQIYAHQAMSSVNCVRFAPAECGLLLAAACGDGSVIVLARREGDNWEIESRFNAHDGGCNAVSWCPTAAPASLLSPNVADVPVKRLATGGCDGLVNTWRHDGRQFLLEHRLEGHTSWVRDVAFAPSIGVPGTCLASGSQDRSVIIWTWADQSGQWTKQSLTFDDTVWRVSWSEAGDILAVSSGEDKVSLWKEGLDGTWSCLKEMRQEHEE